MENEKNYNPWEDVDRKITEAEQKKNSKPKYELSDYSYYPAKDCDDEIRMIPQIKDGAVYPRIEELTMHFQIGKSNILVCPRQFSRICPVCDFIDELNQKGVDYKEFSRKKSQKLYYTPVILRKDAKLQPRWWGLNKTSLVLIREMDKKDRTKNFWHPMEGLDFVINKQDKTQVTPILERKPLLPSKKEIKELMDSVPALNEVFLELSSDIIRKILQKDSLYIKYHGGSSNDSHSHSESDFNMPDDINLED